MEMKKRVQEKKTQKTKEKEGDWLNRNEKYLLP